MQKSYKDKGVVMLALTDEPEATIRAFLKTNPINYPVGYGAYKARQAHGVNSYPTIFVYDAGGRRVYKGHSTDEAERALQKSLKDSPPTKS